MTRPGRLSRLLAPFRRPAHIGWGGDPVDAWTPLWEPDPRGQVR